MKILHVLDSFEMGGAQQVALLLAEHQAANESNEVVVIGATGPLVSHFRRAGIRVHVSRKRVPDVSTMWGFIQLALKFRPDIVHSHQRREALLAHLISRATGSRTIEHAHTLLPGRTARRFSFLSDHVIAVSPEVEAMLLQRFRIARSRVTLALNAPAVEQRTPTSGSIDNWPGDGVRILGVGRLSEQKDPLRFVRVLSEMAKTLRVSGVWIGEGDMRSQAEELAAQLRAPVVFLGRRDDVAEWMTSADLLLMTSRWEGLPLVALEALTLGLTVVAPAIDGLSTLLSTDRGTPSGYLFQPDAEGDAIAQEVAAALHDPGRDERRTRGRLLVEANYGRTRLCRIVDSAYSNLWETHDAK